MTVSFDLRQVSQALQAAGKVGQAYNPAPGFERPFSALLAMEVSRGMREGRAKAPTADDIRADVPHGSPRRARWLSGFGRSTAGGSTRAASRCCG